MKTPDEIKKELERCTTYIYGFPCEGCLYGIDAEKVESDCVDALLKDALAYIQQLENYIGELTEKVSQLEAAQPKWISVEERLPDDRGNFITKIHCDNGDWIEVNTFDHMEKEWWHDAVNHTVKATEFVTHWMPLPEAPKEDVKK